MSVRRIAVAVVFAVALGVLIAAPLGDEREISVRVWLAAAGSWLALGLLRNLLSIAPVARPERQRRGWAWWKKRVALPPDMRPRDLRTLDVLVQTACDNERGHAVRLRPRLLALAEHGLPLRHGVDLHARPDRAAAVLGDVAWLIDPTIRDRVPTVDELDRFLDRVLPEAV